MDLPTYESTYSRFTKILSLENAPKAAAVEGSLSGRSKIAFLPKCVFSSKYLNIMLAQKMLRHIVYNGRGYAP